MFVPRPILKRCPASECTYGPQPQPQPRTTNCVRFPPSPTLTRTFTAHSAATYDRSPIVVLPNTCALPARGCPGRTYLPGDPPHSPNSEKKRALKNKGKSMHPRAVEQPVPTPSAIPSLVPDVSSSESDESDGFTSPPPHSPASFVIPKSSAPMTPAALADALDSNLSFLPHAPSSQLHKHHEPEEEHQYHTYEEEKRRRRERTRWEHDRRHRMKAHDSARELERQTAEFLLDEEELEENDDEDDDLACAPAARYKTFGSASALSGLSLDDPDDGCLAGF